MKTFRQPAAPQPIPGDKPLIRKEELERAKASLKQDWLTPEQLADAQARCDRRGNWTNKTSYNPDKFPPRRTRPPNQF